MKVELNLPEVPGYEYTGEYRCPKIGEFFCNKTKPYNANMISLPNIRSFE